MNDRKINSNMWFAVLTIVIGIGMIAYLAIYARNAMQSGIITVEALSYVSYDSVSTEGIIARDEDPISETGFGNFVYTAAQDGKHVSAGEDIAYSYSSEAVWKATERKHIVDSAMEKLSDALDIRGVLSQERYDTMMREDVAELSAKAAAGDYRVARELAERTLIVAKGALDPGGTLVELRRESAALPATTAQSMTAEVPALFSRYVDGFLGMERLKPANLKNLMPDELTALLTMTPATSNSVIGKLIYGRKWYFAANVDESTGAKLALKIGSEVKMLIDGLREPVTMRIDSVSLPQSGFDTVVFTCDYALQEVCEMRITSANLILSEHKGLRVPRDALRLESRTSGGEQLPCVYIVAGPYLERKFVKIIHEEDEWYILDDEVYTDDALRSGDMVVVGGSSLYDGKIVQ